MLHAHAAAQLADHVLHGVQSDAATGHLGDLLAHAEAGQEEKRQEFLLAQLRHGLGGGELAIEHGLAQALQIDAAAVVAQFQDQHAGVVAGADGDPALGRLAGGEAGFRRLDTVIDGIAQQVGERRFEFFQDIPVDLGAFALDQQAHLLAQRAAQVANHPRLAAKDVGEWPHPRGQRRVVEHLGTLAALPGELVEIGDVLHQHLLAFANQLPRLAEHGLGLRVEGGFLDRLAYHVERAAGAGLQATQALQGIGQRLDALELHQRLAGDIQQPVQAFGGDPQDPAAALLGLFAARLPGGLLVVVVAGGR